MKDEEKVIKFEKKQFMPLETFLLAYMQKRNLKTHHLPGLKAHANGKTVATKEEWEKVFSTY